MKKLFVLILINLIISSAMATSSTKTYQDIGQSLFNAHANQTRYYKTTKCPKVFENLIHQELDQQNIWVETADNEPLQIQTASIQFCGVKDLTQGAYNIERALIFCVDAEATDRSIFAASLYAKTQGDLFCTAEKLKKILGVWVH